MVVNCADVLRVSVLNERLNHNLDLISQEEPNPSLGPKISLPPSEISKVPMDIYLEICDLFSLRELVTFSEVCRDTLIATKMSIAKRLARINPYYVFTEDWINLLIYRVITEDGRRIEFNRDLLELSTFKFITGQRTLVDHVDYRFILRFLHKTVYGITSVVPNNSKEWRISLTRRVQSDDMPLTKTFVQEYYDNHPSLLDYDVSTWTEMIEFFSSKPSIADQVRFLGSINQHSQNHYTSAFTLPHEFRIIFEENLRI